VTFSNYFHRVPMPRMSGVIPPQHICLCNLYRDKLVFQLSFMTSFLSYLLKYEVEQTMLNNLLISRAVISDLGFVGGIWAMDGGGGDFCFGFVRACNVADGNKAVTSTDTN
jgi:hypothetical protein